MEGKAQLALAVAAGYLLGRRRKLRLALTLAAAGAAGGLGAVRGGLLKRGVKILGSSPELGKVAESVRGGLIEAGKAAAVTAASRQINSLSSKLSERAKASRSLTGLEGEAGEEEEGEEPVERPRRKVAAGAGKEPVSRLRKEAEALRRPTAGARRRAPARAEEPEAEEAAERPARSRGAGSRERAPSPERPVRRVRR